MTYGNALIGNDLAARPPQTKTTSITARVSDDFRKRWQAKAEEVPGRTSTQLAREVLEQHLDRAPIEQALLEEVWATRFTTVNALLDIVSVLVPDQHAALKQKLDALKAEADSKKGAKARALLNGGRP